MPALIRLEAIIGPEPVVITEVDSGVLSVGREMDNSIVVDSSAVSRYHGTFFEAGSQWFYRDLGSTNGSWVNGIKVQPAQIRLLRHLDVVQTADFPIRLTQIEPPPSEEGIASFGHPQSLIVFYGDQFQGEFDFDEPGKAFLAGGSVANLKINQLPREQAQLIIESVNGRIELKAESGGVPVVVNGLVMGGTTALVDRDEVSIGPYCFIVNDIASASVIEESQKRVGFAGKPPESDTTVPSVVAGAGARSAFDDSDWQSSAKQTPKKSERSFVFGTMPGETDSGDTSSTQTLVAQRSGTFETHPSLRFAGAAEIPEHEEPLGPSQKSLVLYGIIAVVVIVVAVVILAKLFSV